MNDETTEILLDILIHLSIQLDELNQLQYAALTGKTDWQPRDYYTLTQQQQEPDNEPDA
jgi:hypothetical protein